MSPRRPPLPGFVALLACALGAWLALGHGAARAGDATVHGLANLPDDRAVPQAWLPPGATDPDVGPSSVVFPPQKLTLRFNHQKHVKELGATCLTCHFKAKESTSAEDRLIPLATTCDACHETDHRSTLAVKPGTGAIGQCGFCHLGWHAEDGNVVARTVIPTPNLRFSHKAHLDRNVRCAQCHGSVERLELATRDQMPRMNGCFGCHDMPPASQGDAKGACLTCHLSQPDGRMRTMFSSGELKPPRWLHDARHGPDFIERHKRVAADDTQFCSTCHKEDFCTDCHDGKVRPRSIHPNDFISMHPIAARQDNPRCTSCHQEQTFCLGCHQRAGVTLSGPNAAGRKFHPAGWADVRTRGPGHHAWEAQRNLNACVSCHTERDCAMCHAATGRNGLGVNPHPAGFVSSCAGPLRRNGRPCLVCHEPTSPQIAMCR